MKPNETKSIIKEEEEEENNKTPSSGEKSPKTSKLIAGGNAITFKNDSIWKTFIEILFTCSAAILI